MSAGGTLHVNREGTLHIVWINRGQHVPPQYHVGFADYSSSGGAMKMKPINGEAEMRNFLTLIGMNQRIIQSTFDNLALEGSTSIMRVMLPDEVLVSVGLKERFLTGKDKVEAAITLLRKQGHQVEPVIVADGTMWFQVDREVLVAWKQMQDLGEGVYSFEGLLQIYKALIPVRFSVFVEPTGPILAFAVAEPYMSTTFASKAGTRYQSSQLLIATLDKVGLPGKEIVEMKNPAKVYTLTGAQLLFLNLVVPTLRP
jgi:hypothetical protein